MDPSHAALLYIANLRLQRREAMPWEPRAPGPCAPAPGASRFARLFRFRRAGEDRAAGAK
jgi:hypothetical protein